MSVVVYCGPTISAAEVREHVDAICLPPVGYGDVLRAVEMSPKPFAIAIIDGVFRTVPAVRHKEILWALHHGVHVFGAASMGALRAAELSDYGMVGFGSIYFDLRSGRIEDDDEVAVEHGPPELGFLPISEAMVDIRATLDAAVRDNIISHSSARFLIDQAKRTFYAERRWPELFDRARGANLVSTEIEGLERWLPAGRIHRKREDALEMLAAIRDFVATDPPPFEPKFSFERTDVWDLDYQAGHSFSQTIENGRDALLVQDILDELRLRPDDYAVAQGDALARALSIREARRQGVGAGPKEVEGALREWLRECGTSLEKALEENRLGVTELEGFLKEEALVRWTAETLSHVAHDKLIDALLSRGTLASLIKRAEAKRHALRAMGAEGATTQTSGISPAALLGWLWRQTYPGHMQMSSPEVLAHKIGFSDVSTMNRALLREYLFREHSRERSIPVDGAR